MEKVYSKFFINFLVSSLILVLTGTTVYSHLNTATPVQDIPLQVDHMAFTQCARTAELRVRGGLPPYRYVWMKDGVEVKVDNISDGSMSILTMAQAGNYTVNVFDNSNSPQSLSQTFNFVDSRNFQFDLNFGKDYLCEGKSYGKVVGEILGGAAPFKFNFYESVNEAPKFSATSATRQVDIREIPSGKYTVEIIDNSGCKEIVEVTLEQILPLTFQKIEVLSEDCEANGEFTYQVTGFSGDVQYKIIRISDNEIIRDWAVAPNGLIKQDKLFNGIYEVHVIDANRKKTCPEKFSVTIPDHRRIIVTAWTKPVTCFGGNDGVIYLEILRINLGLGGTSQNVDVYHTPPGGVRSKKNTVGLGNPLKVEVYENAVGGLHKFEVEQGGTRNSNCVLTLFVEVNMPPGPLAASSTSTTPVSCFGGADGTATVDVTGGWGGYTYQWNDPLQQKTKTATRLRAGTYEVTVTDKQGCSKKFPVTVVGPPGEINATFSTDPATCVGTADGSATVTATGGWGAPFKYLWSNGQEGQTVNNLPPGENFVLITDKNGCTKEFPFNVPIAEEPGVVIAEQAPTCFGSNNGVIKVNIDNPTHNYIVKAAGVTKSGAEVLFTDLAPGTYEVVISYGNGCEIIKWATVPDVPKLELDNSETIRNDILCFGQETGSITGIKILGGNGGNQIVWQKLVDSNFVTIPGQTSLDLFNVGAGSYRLNVTDAKGCFLQHVYILNQPGEFKLDNKVVGNVSCFGRKDGSIALAISGGVAPYTYSYNGGPEQTTANVLISLTNLAAGTGNTVLVRDANNCQLPPVVFDIQQPQEILIEQLSLQKESCFNTKDASIKLEISGGSGNLDIRWTRRGSTTSIGATKELNNLGPGEYVVTVKDLNNPTCEVVREYLIPVTPELVITPSVTNILCFGNNTGAINLNIAGGTLNPGDVYSIQWTGPNGFTSTSASISDLFPGTYSVSVKDSNNCETTSTNIEVRQPVAPVTVGLINAVNPSCHNGTNGRIEISVGGGTGNKVISWAKWNGSDYITVPGTNTTLAGLAPGRYMATAIDQNGCPQNLEVTLINPEPLVVTILEKNDPTCFGVNDGSIKISVTGGSGAPYNFSWSHGSSRQNPTNLGGGVYTVTVRDAFGCEVTSEEITLVEPAQLGIQLVEIKDPECFGSPSHIEVNLLGGVESQRKTKWTNLTTNEVIVDSYGVNRIDGLTPGFYELRYSNNGFCELTRIYQVRGPAEKLELIIDTTPNECGVESISLYANGGIPAYRFRYLRNGEWVQINAALLSSLGGGQHTFKVMDSKNCEDVKTVSLSGQEPAFVQADKVQDVTCFGNGDGIISYEISGATHYSWYKLNVGTWEVLPNYNFKPTQNGRKLLEDLTDGVYKLRVFYNDSQDCSEDSEDILVIEPLKLEIANPSWVQPECWNELGSFSLSVRGGNTNKRIVLTKPDNTFEVIEDINNNTQYTFENLVGGNYSYAIEDEYCDPILGTFIINSVQRPTVEGIEINDVSCFGANDGSFIMLSPTVAVGRGFYVYINGERQALNKVDFGPFAPGRYAVRMEDTFGCESEEYSVDIEEPNRPLAITEFQKQDITCFGAGNGRATFQIIGGRETYSAVLTKVGDASFVVMKDGINEITQVSFENLEVGNYRIEVKDQQDRCQTDITFTITTPDIFTATQDYGTINCIGGTTFISVNLSGGVAPFNVKYFSIGEGGTKYEVFAHNINGNRSLYNNVGPGSYLYEVRDANGCLISPEDKIIINDGQLLQFTYSKQDEKCYNGFEGSISIIATGSNDNQYSYYVNNRKVPSNIITGLGRGTYSVYVMNEDNCASPVQTITIDGPEKALSFTQYTQTNLSCFESTDGKITLRLTGGTAPYNVMFDGQSYQLEEDVTQIFENLTAEKQYNFQVTDANGCSLELFPRTLTQPDPLLVADRFQPILCYGGTTEIQLSVTGGTSPFVVAWNYSQDGVTFSPLTETGRTLVSAYAGHYQYTLTDAKGCTFSNTIIVPQPELLDFSFDVTDVTCFRGEDGAIELFPTGGLSGDYRLFVNNREVVAIDNRYVLNDLKFGNYTAYFTRGNCISETKTIRVSQPLAGISVNLLYQEDVNCYEGVTDVIFNIQGGNGIYTAYLNDTEITHEGNQIIFTDVRAGNYTLRVVDQKGCGWTEQITITEPQPVMVTNAAIKTVTCFEGGDGEIQLTVAGGTGVIRYEWTDLSSGDVIGFNDNLKNLAIGNYRVRIYDDRGCEIIEEYEVEGVEAIAFEAETVDVSCFGGNNGEISVKNITGGRGNFRLVIDGIVRSGLTVSNLTAKAGYEVMLIDGSGCMSEIITVDINQPVALAVQSTATPETCYNANNGTITLAIQGGVGPYIVRWGDQQLGSSRTGLFPGVYQYVVTDLNGCTFSGSARVERADPLQLDAEVSPVLCHGEATGKIVLQVMGGTGTYTYAWRKSGSDAVVATTKDLQNVASGDYRVTITDSNNCVISRNFTINQPSQPLTVEGLAIDIRCFGEENGEIRLSLQGGTGFRTVRWHDNDSDVRIRTGLKEGNYTVTVTDENGCSDTKTFTINEPDPIQVTTVAVDNVSCKGGNDGKATISISGGAGGYIVQWVHNGSNLLSQEGLSAGTYAILVSDRNFCQVPYTVTVGEPLEALSAVVNVNLEICGDQNSMVVEVAPAGGTPQYRYEWSVPSWTGSRQVGIAPGEYWVKIIDAKNCEVTKTFTVYNAEIQFTATPAPVICHGGATGSITVSDITGGIAPYTMFVNGLAVNGFTRNGLFAGTYTVSVRDANNCEVQKQDIEVTEPAPLEYTFEITHETCFNAKDGIVKITPMGGVGNYTIKWDNNNRDWERSNLAPGRHTFVIMDDNRCEIPGEINVLPATQLVFTLEDVIPVKCFGDATGGVNIRVTGGLPNYTYSWFRTSDLSTVISEEQNLSNVPAGNYIVKVLDANLCVLESRVYQITQPIAPLTAIAAKTDITCFGDANGTINLAINGGTGTKTVTWSDSNIEGASRSGLSAGIYTYIVTDASLCTTTGSIEIREPLRLIVNETPTNVSCNGGSNGAISLAIEGGTGTPRVRWEHSASTASSLTGLAAGSYTYTVTDANGCFVSNTIIITEPEFALSADVEIRLEVCGDQSTMIVEAKVQGGTAGYTYEWSETSWTGPLQQGVAPGNYSVKITDANGCIINKTFTVYNAVIDFTVDKLDVTCKGGTNGSISVSNITGGISPYTMTINGTPANSFSRSGLAAGSYTIRVADASNRCFIERTVVIEEPTQLGYTAVPVAETCFNANDGRVTVTPSGGAGGYTIRWDNNSTDFERTGMAPRQHTFVITDANGCTFPGEVTIAPATQMTFTAEEVVAVKCFGEATGSVNITIGGGKPGYTYAWARTSDLTNIISTSQNLTGVGSGTYNVRITDQNGCSINKNYQITQPAAALAAVASKTDITCFGAADGTVNLTITGGTGTKTVTWADTNVEGASRSGLSAGTYNFTVTDANLCITTGSIEIREPDQLVVTPTPTDISCKGGNDGAITIAITGGTGTPKIRWEHTASTAASLTGLTAGSYTYTVTDANNCTVTNTITLAEPAAVLSAEVEVVLEVCGDQSTMNVEVKATGGNGGYTYEWSETSWSGTRQFGVAAGNYSVKVTDAKGCTITKTFSVFDAVIDFTVDKLDVTCKGGTNGSISVTDITGGISPYTMTINGTPAISFSRSGLAAGSYTIRVADASNRCFIERTVIIEEPTQLGYTAVPVAETCFNANDGKVEVTPSGGVGGYTIRWDNNSTEFIRTGMAPRQHTFVITDANGCTFPGEVTIAPATQLVFTAETVEPVKCFGEATGAINITVGGGKPGYNYAWTNTSDINTVISTERNLTNVPAGTYRVLVTDVNGCRMEKTFQITQPAAALAVVPTKTDISCYGTPDGTISLTISGGTGNKTVTWADTEVEGATRTGLAAGIYFYTVTDANNCKVTGSVEIREPAELLVSNTIVNVSCKEGNDGSVTLDIQGGTGTPKIRWEHTASTAATLTGLRAGNYTYTVTDDKNCTVTKTITVTEPEFALTADVVVRLEVCGDQSSMVVEVNTQGGTPGYTYQWSEASWTGAVQQGVAPGQYSVIITDAKNCSVTKTFTVYDAVIDFEVQKFDVSCKDGNNGSITVSNITGGIAPYTMTLNGTPVNTFNRAGLTAGTYVVKIADASNRCFVERSIVIEEPEQLAYNIESKTDESCFGANNGSVKINPTGGVGNYTIRWTDNLSAGFERTGLFPGRYTFTLIDQNGDNQCSIPGEVIISAATQITIVNEVVTNIRCFGEATGGIQIEVEGGKSPYTYKWINIATQETVGTSANLTNVRAGRYSVEIKDGNDCVITKTYTVTQPSSPLTVTGLVFDVNCHNDANGQIQLIVEGGVGPMNIEWLDIESSAITRTGLAPGLYRVRVTDNNYCSVTQTFEIANPAPIKATVIQKVDNDCKGDANGTIEVSLSGGKGNLAITWVHNGSRSWVQNNLRAGTYVALITDGFCTVIETFEISEPAFALEANVVVDANICGDEYNVVAEVIATGGNGLYTYLWNDARGSTTAKVTDLMPGTYKVVITDAKGCKVEKTVEIPAPADPLTISFDGKMGLCFEGERGSLTATVTGGRGRYTYSWSHNPNLTGNVANDLRPGTYTLTVTDESGCSIKQSHTLVAPDAKSVRQVAINQVSCFGANDGIYTMEVKGFIAPFDVKLFRNNNLNRTLRYEDNQFTFDQLGPGEYRIELQDAYGCPVERTFTITQPERLEITQRDIRHISCFGANDGRIVLTVKGGYGNFTYEWADGLTLRRPDRNNLKPGTYRVIIRDGRDCFIEETITIEEPELLVVEVDQLDSMECNGSTDGYIALNVTGGFGLYDIEWKDAPNYKEFFRYDLAAGVYEVKVTDENGCFVTKTVTIEEPSPIEAYIVTSMEVDCEQKTVLGKAFLQVSGGVGNYQLDWNTGHKNTKSVTFTQDGQISVRITDENGCMKEVSTVIEFPKSFATADFDYTVVSTGEKLGEILLGDEIKLNDLSIGGIVKWEWDFGDKTTSNLQSPSHTYQQMGTYIIRLSVTDEFGCTSYSERKVEVVASYRVLVPNAFTPNGDGLNDRFIPLFRGVEGLEYHIFNKWGDLLYSAYSADDPGWDGKVKDRMSPNGNYVYKIYFTTKDGQRKSQSGVFILIH